MSCRPLAQRRQLQGEHVQAEQQVVAEAALGHRALEVAVARGDQADVDLDRLAAADAVDLALLDRAQQLGLQARVHLADLVEQQRAAVRLLELADAPRDRTGEGAPLVAEQLRFQQVLRDGGAVDGDERPLARRLWRCTKRAIISLPVPLSPVIRTQASAVA